MGGIKKWGGERGGGEWEGVRQCWMIFSKMVLFFLNVRIAGIFFKKLYWLYGFFRKLYGFLKKCTYFFKKCTDCTGFFSKIVRIFFENCTNCTDFFWKCTDFCTDGFKKVLATLFMACWRVSRNGDKLMIYGLLKRVLNVDKLMINGLLKRDRKWWQINDSWLAEAGSENVDT